MKTIILFILLILNLLTSCFAQTDSLSVSTEDGIKQQFVCQDTSCEVWDLTIKSTKKNTIKLFLKQIPASQNSTISIGYKNIEILYKEKQYFVQDSTYTRIDDVRMHILNQIE